MACLPFIFMMKNNKYHNFEDAARFKDNMIRTSPKLSIYTLTDRNPQITTIQRDFTDSTNAMTEHDLKNSKRINVEPNTKSLPNQNSEKYSHRKLKNKTIRYFRLEGKNKICIIILVDILFCFFYAGANAIYNFLPTFCLEYLKWTVFNHTVCI